MARARGANAVMALAFETTYGTPPGSGFKKVPFVSSQLGEQQDLIASDLLGYGRDPQQPARDVINNDGDVVVPLDLRNFGYWLKLLFGSPTTTQGTAARWWLAGGAFAMGLGVWSMHFVGMLAFDLPIPLGYDVTLTACSMLAAVGSSAALATAPMARRSVTAVSSMARAA